MKWKAGSLALLILSTASVTQASEKPQIKIQQKEPDATVLQDPEKKPIFHLFPTLLHELQEDIVKKFIYDSLGNCKSIKDYAFLYSALWTNHTFQEYALRALREISRLSEVAHPELRYNFEILRLHAFYTAATTSMNSEQCTELSCTLHLMPLVYSADNVEIRKKKKLHYQAIKKLRAEKPDIRKIGAILTTYILTDDAKIADAKVRFALLKRAEDAGHYLMLTQLIHRCAAFYAAHSDTMDINEGDSNNVTLLFSACEYGCETAVEKLLSLKAIDVNKAADSGDTPLIAACQGACHMKSGNPRGIRNCVKLLLSRAEIKLNAPESNADITPLMWAAMSGDVELVQILLDDPRIEVNTKDCVGWTALMGAIQNNHEAIIELLLSREGIDSDGALFAATRFGRLEIMRKLCKIPTIKVNAQITHDKTALMEALHHDDGLENGREYVLRQFAPEWFEERSHAREMVQLLLTCKNIDFNLQDFEGSTALMSAVRSGDEELVKLILEQEVDVNIQEHQWGPGGHTALHVAVREEQDRIVEILLTARDIDVNLFVEGPDYETPQTALMMAVDGGNIGIVRLLLASREIDVNISRDGQNALSIAKAKGHHAIIALLIAAGATMPQEEAAQDEEGDDQ